ncbi:alpha/beta hydrolase [Yeosuana marina]|uniref:alpha/beta hydrolase n=1 Tax=Yeosuana marina TaxID=1565536 RepID=UPI0030C89C9F
MINKIVTFFIFSWSALVISQTRYIDTVFDNITVKTYNYSIRNSDTLKLDLYEPKNDNCTNRPLFVIVHGGGFTSGERNNYSLVSLAESITKKGYVVASIDYSLLSKNKLFSCDIPLDEEMTIYAEAGEDLLSALAYLIKYKEDFLINESKIILFGLSAGAETVLNITYNRDLLIPKNETYKNIKPAAVISISGACLNSDLITNTIPGVFYHGNKDEIIPYDRDSHHFCDPTEKGFLIMDGSNRIVEKLKALDSSFMFYTYKDRGHDIFNLPTDDFYQTFVFLKKVVFDNTFYQAQIIE